MKKIIILIAGALVLFISGYIIGQNSFIKGNIASIIIKNQSEHSIMTATINHETGSSIAANIKKGRSQRARIFTKGMNSYSINITFDDNRTIYSDSARTIKNGDVTIETVRDSVIVRTTGN